MYAAIIVGHLLVTSTVTIRDYTSAWDRPGELVEVRRRRPHAGERDPDLVHDEFAVTVEDEGEIWVWRFRPLAADQPADPERVLVPGRPRYDAEVVAVTEFEPADAAISAELLVKAQEDAAQRERDARDAVLRDAERLDEREELRTTTAALRHLTGQARR